VLFTTVFATGAALAGLGGALAAPLVSVGPGLHVQVIIDAFVVVVIGGMGSILGAVVCGLMVGLLESVLSLAVGEGIATAAVYSLLLAVLLVRPYGLAGKKAR